MRTAVRDATRMLDRFEEATLTAEQRAASAGQNVAAGVNARLQEMMALTRNNAQQASAVVRRELAAAEAAVQRTAQIAQSIERMRAASAIRDDAALATKIAGADPFQAAASGIANVERAATSGAHGIGKVRQELTTLTRQLLNISPITAQAGVALSGFAVGAGLQIALIAGIAAIGYAWNRYTSAAREAEEQTRKLNHTLQELARGRDLAGAATQAQTLFSGDPFARFGKTPGETDADYERRRLGLQGISRELERQRGIITAVTAAQERMREEARQTGDFTRVNSVEYTRLTLQYEAAQSAADRLTAVQQRLTTEHARAIALVNELSAAEGERARIGLEIAGAGGMAKMIDALEHQMSILNQLRKAYDDLGEQQQGLSQTAGGFGRIWREATAALNAHGEAADDVTIRLRTLIAEAGRAAGILGVTVPAFRPLNAPRPTPFAPSTGGIRPSRQESPFGAVGAGPDVGDALRVVVAQLRGDFVNPVVSAGSHFASVLRDMAQPATAIVRTFDLLHSAIRTVAQALLGTLKGAAIGLAQAFNPLAIFADAIAQVANALRPALEPLAPIIAQFAAVFADAIAPIIQALIPVLQQLLPVVNAILRVLAPLIRAFVPLLAALVPIIRALFPIIKIVAIALTYVGEVFYRISAVLLRVVGNLAIGIGGVVEGIGRAIDAIPGISAKGIIHAGEGIQNFGREVLNSSDEMRRGADEMRKARDEISGISLDDTIDAIDDLGSSANMAAEAMRNVASWWKVELAVSQIARPVANPFGPGWEGLFTPRGTIGTGGGGNGGGGLTLVLSNVSISTQAKDGEQLFDELIAVGRKRASATFGVNSAHRWPELA